MSLRKLSWSTAAPYLFLAPALCVLSLSVFWPALQAFYLSFTQFETLGQTPEWIGLGNFERLWTDDVFWQSLKNSLIYLIGVVPILVILPLGLAILVNQKLKGIHWFRAAYYTPVVISMVVAGIAWKWLYDERGLLNQGISLITQNPLMETILGQLGWTGEPIVWLQNPDIALYCVMAVTVWKGLGYYMVIYLAGLQAIPPDLYEAAAIDGADGWQKHWDITIPLMKPYLMLVSVISAISAAKVFEEVYVMTPGGGVLGSTITIVANLYEQAFSEVGNGYSYACAMGLVLFLLIFGLSILNLKLGQLRG
ncbi:carbohydrate ABC transporter permease [Acaryochloris marina]|uniref:Sugar ABC transporter, permease protein, putative n=1 Tax=Acaryochloris marina (strain MBIC 11017) TaxID=329726 RepID=B0C8J7_ACAM1|nr:sugar ABC transporter permease [Acaryochloris marina]ABW30152.1 sugar ABC transporter, permease protein, putative [Acaryochloris marina MBIC11017]BDM78998.1 lactose ABC transporter permease [Acaryochloris marina MBIC10699]